MSALLIQAGCNLYPTKTFEAPEDYLDLLISENLAAQNQHEAIVEFVPTDTFDSQIKYFIAKSSAVNAALESSSASAKGIDIAKSAFAPQVSSYGGAGATAITPNSSIDIDPLYSLNISQVLYDGNARGLDVNAASLLNAISQLQTLKVYNDTAYQGIEIWIDRWLSQERESLLAARRSTILDAKIKIEKLATAGLIDKAAMFKLEAVESEFNFLESAIKLKKDRSTETFSENFTYVNEVIKGPSHILNRKGVLSDYEEKLSLSPGLLELKAEILLAQTAVSSAKSAFHPKVIGSSSLSPTNSDDNSNGDPELMLGVRMNYTLGDGGLRKARLEQAVSNVSVAELRYHAALEADLLKLRKFWMEFISLKTKKKHIETQLQLNNKTIQAQSSQLATGKVDFQQLFALQIEKHDLSDQLVSTIAQAFKVEYQIAHMVGELSDKFS